MSIPVSSLIDLFVQSVTEYMSLTSGLSLHIDLNTENYVGQIYAIRRITEDGIGFGEISHEFITNYILQNPDHEFVYDSVELLSFVKQKLKTISFKNDMDFFTRNAIIKIGHEFKHKVTGLMKEKEFNFFVDKEGELISGTVVRLESDNIILNLGFGEGFLSKYEMMPGDFFPIGSTVQAYIYEVSQDLYKYQIKLSRTRPEFLGRLMESIIPEIENGLIEIKSIARDPGSRAKVAVYADEYSNIDPVGACIGRDGIRIKSIRSVIGNERIDIVRWDPDIVVFVGNALGIQINKVIMHEDALIEVIFSDDHLFKLKSNRQQQVRLVSRLTKRRIKLTSIEEDEQRVQHEKEVAEKVFSELDLGEAEIKKLFKRDINSLDDIVALNPESLMEILSCSLEEAQALLKKAEDSIFSSLKSSYMEAGIDYELASLPYLEGMPPEFFKQNKIYTKEDLAHMDSEEVQKLFEGYLSDDVAVEDEQCDNIVKWSRNIRRND
jgi:N utilization substance protein A